MGVPCLPMKLSVAIITRNESANIERCLRSVSFADEVVVLDHDSADGTAERARTLGAKVVVVSDWPGFGIQKNRALDLCTGDWVLSLDADEEVSPALQAQIVQAIQANTTQAFMLPRRTQFCGQWIRHCGWTPDRVLRLFPAGQARFTPDLVHERLETNLAIRYLKAPLLHYSYPTPEHYWRKLSQYSQAWARQRLDAGRNSSPGRALVSGLFAFVKSYVLRLGFLDGWAGLNVCLMQAQAAYGKHLTLYWLWINRQRVEKE
jgi:glycosyltransferase involved in cell wall biosynthesis